MNIYWMEQCESDVPANDHWLHPNELARLDTIRFPKRRNDWRLGRWTAKRAIAEYLDVPVSMATLSRIEIFAAPSGAPRVSLGQSSCGLSISLSHSNGLAACAVSDSDVVLGCDLEAIDPRSESFITDYFTAEEQSFLLNSDFSSRTELINVIWSAKESALKALEEGLRLDTRCVNVTLDCRRSRADQGWLPLYVRAAGGRDFYGWHHTAAGFARTLVADPRPPVPIVLQLRTTSARDCAS